MLRFHGSIRLYLLRKEPEMDWLMVLMGGAAGSGLRFGVALALPAGRTSGFPIATLSVNLLGCLLIGLLAAVLGPSSEVPAHVRTGIMVGLLGGFTTFSSFGLDTIRLIQSDQIGSAALYIALSNLAGLLAVWLGTRAGGGLG
jgi:CrcB protein